MWRSIIELDVAGAIAQSQLTAQGQISVPVGVRKKLGIGPGSTLKWEEIEGQIVVRRAGSVSFEDIHRALFDDKPPVHAALEQSKAAIPQYIKKRYALSTSANNSHLARTISREPVAIARHKIVQHLAKWSEDRREKY